MTNSSGDALNAARAGNSERIEPAELARWAEAQRDADGPEYAKPYWESVIAALRQPSEPNAARAGGPEQAELLPCRKCGSTDIDHWNGQGTQAEMSCNECGCGESVQVTDILSYEERYSGQHDFSTETLSYPPASAERARQQLFKEWNTRQHSEPVAVEQGADEEKDSLLRRYRDIRIPETSAVADLLHDMALHLYGFLRTPTTMDEGMAAAQSVEVLAARVRELEAENAELRNSIDHALAQLDHMAEPRPFLFSAREH